MTKFLFVLPLIALASCATDYQKEGIFSNGYSDYRLAEDTFVVTFRANEYTSPEKVKKYALRRAAELAVRHGYSHFAILSEKDTSKERTVIHSKTEGNEKTGTISQLHYPSLSLTIHCYHEKPAYQETINAKDFLAYNSIER